MSERHDAARAALEAALAATSAGAPQQPGTPGADSTAAAPRKRRRKGTPPDAEQDLQNRDGEPDPYDVARQIVLRQLAMAPRSRHQLRDKLRRRNCPDEVAEAVLDRMTEVGLVDDEAFAGMVVRSQQVSRGLAKRALARELRAKGVDDETARAALDEVHPDAEQEQAERLVAKKLRTMHGLDAAVQTRRLAGMLARKGYPADLSMRVIRDAVAAAPEHQRD